MSKYDIITSSLLFILATLFFLLLNFLIKPFMDGAELLSFVITSSSFILFQDNLKTGVRKIVSKQHYLLLGRTRQVLEKLNSNLNSAIRYHAVIHELFEAFKRLFGLIPHAFYILEDEKYHLSHYANINDDDLLSLELNSDYLLKLSPNNNLISDFRELSIPPALVKKLRDNGMTRLLPFHGHSQVFAFLVIDPKLITFFNDKTTWKLFEKIQKKTGLILENSALFVDLEKKHYETRKLIEVSQKVLSSFDTKNTLDFILKSLKTLINFDAGAVFLLEKSGKRLLNTSSHGYHSTLNKQLHLKVGQGACGWVVKTKKTDVLDDVRLANHYYNFREETRSQISIPLVFDEDVLGVLCLESNRLAYFNKNVVEILRLFAHLAVIAIHNARQFEIVLAKQAFEHELVNASNVQQRLLVQRFPKFEGFSLTAVNIPSKLVSGDLYDVITYNDDNLGIAIGDVSGKGAPAALMMTLILAGLRSQKKTFLTVCDVVFRLNNLLFESTIEGKYATFFLGIIARKENKLIYTNAGHNPPIFIKADGQVELLSQGGIVLGFLADMQYKQAEITFEKDDILVAYTDGISEAMNDNEEEFGDERLIEIILKHRRDTVYEIRAAIFKAVQEFTNSEIQSDDMTLMICKRD